MIYSLQAYTDLLLSLLSVGNIYIYIYVLVSIIQFFYRATSEYFYWQEDTNRYSWVKPPVPQKAVKVLEYIPLEEEVYFKFPGERGEGIGIIKRLRFDDQTGEDCYDVQHKYKQELYIKWVTRYMLLSFST